jgi:hypothetical protein
MRKKNDPALARVVMRDNLPGFIRNENKANPVAGNGIHIVR